MAFFAKNDILAQNSFLAAEKGSLFQSSDGSLLLDELHYDGATLNLSAKGDISARQANIRSRNGGFSALTETGDIILSDAQLDLAKSAFLEASDGDIIADRTHLNAQKGIAFRAAGISGKGLEARASFIDLLALTGDINLQKSSLLAAVAYGEGKSQISIQSQQGAINVTDARLQADVASVIAKDEIVANQLDVFTASDQALNIYSREGWLALSGANFRGREHKPFCE